MKGIKRWVGIGCGAVAVAAALAYGQSQDYSISPGKALILGDPINAASGGYSLRIPLFEFNGPIPFDYALSYQTKRGFTTRACNKIELYGFDHNIPMAIQYTHFSGIPLQMFAYGDDEEPVFMRSGGTNYYVTGDSPIRYALKGSGSISNGWHYLADPVAERVYMFEKVPSPEGVYSFLRFIEDRRGNRITLAYATPTNRYPASLSDGLGRVLTFAYTNLADQQPHLHEVSDQAGRAYRFEYDGNDVLTRIIQPDGGVQTFAHADSSGRLLESVTHPGGNVPYRQYYVETNYYSTFSYCVTQQVAADGSITRLAYEKDSVLNERRVTETRPDLFTNIYTHYGQYYGNMTPKRLTDALGNSTTFIRDKDSNQGNVGGVTDRLHAVTRLVPHAPSGWIEALTNALGETLLFSFHTNHLQTFTNPANAETVTFAFSDIARVDYPDGTFEAFEYDDAHRVVRRVNRDGQAFGFGYNERGLFTSVTNPAGGITAFTYHANGLPESIRQGSLAPVYFDYDEAFRLTAIRQADGGTNRWYYDPMGRATQRVDALGNIFAWTYDANGNLVRDRNPGGEARYSYDAMDRMTGAVDRAGHTTSYAFDPMGRLASSLQPEGLLTTARYDGRDLLTELTSGGQSWLHAYDAEGTLIASTSPLGHSWGFGRDPLGRPTSVTNPLGQASSLTLDNWDAVLAYATPSTQTWRFAYASNGLPARIEDPAGHAASFQYTPHGLLARLSDFNGQAWSFDWSPDGLLTNHANPLGQSVRLAYDALGRVAATRRPDGHVVSNSYDRAGRLVRQTSDSGLLLPFAHDYAGCLLEADGLVLRRDAEGRITNSTVNGRTADIGYDGLGRIRQIAYGLEGFVVSYTYHPTSGLPLEVADNLGGVRVAFEHDADGRLTRIRRANVADTFLVYDDADRLLSLQHSNILAMTFEINADGLVTEASLDVLFTNDLPPAQTSLAYDNAGRIASDGYAYDACGRLIQAPGLRLAWDEADRLTNVNETAFHHDGLGRTIGRSENGHIHLYHPCPAMPGAPILAERDDTLGITTRLYVWSPDGRLLYALDPSDSNAPCFYHFDHQGNTLALSGAAGTPTARYACDPFGRVLRQEGWIDQPFVFLGEWGGRSEGTNGLVRLGARWYDTQTARFLTPEPIWPALDDPRLLNPYQYAFADPVNRSDPSGWLPGASLLQGFQMYKMELDRAEWERREVEGGWGLALAAVNDPELRELAMQDPDFGKNFAALFKAVGKVRWNAEIQRQRLGKFLKKNREAIAKMRRMVEARLGDLNRQAAEFKQQQERLRDALRQQRAAAIQNAHRVLAEGDFRKARSFMNEAHDIEGRMDARSMFPGQLELNHVEDTNKILQDMRQFE